MSDRGVEQATAQIASRADSLSGCYMAWKRWHGHDFGRVGPEESVYFKQELRACGIPSPFGLRVGELGFGNGAFAGWLRDRGGLWVGREAIPELQQRAVAAGYSVIEPGVDFAHACGRGQLDVIVAFDVIEHMDLTALRGFLREAKEALKPGGLVLLRFPSGDSPFSSAIYRGDLTHSTLLGSSALRQLAIEARLEVIQLRGPVLPSTGYGPIRFVRRVVVRTLQWLVFGFIRTILMGNSTAVMSPNMIAVLRSATVTG